MGRNSSIVSESELFAWVAANKGTPRLVHPHRRGSPSLGRRASLWCMAQFDPVRLYSALIGEEPQKGKNRADDDKGWGLRRIVRAYVDILEDDTVDDKGRPKVQPQAKMTVLQRLREFHIAGAATHEEFTESRDGRLPDTMREPVMDPIVLSMRATETESS